MTTLLRAAWGRLTTWWTAWRWAVWLAVLAAAALAGWDLRDQSAQAQIARLMAEHDRQATQATQQALDRSKEAQTQHEATSKRLQTDLAAARAARDAALRGLRALPASEALQLFLALVLMNMAARLQKKPKSSA